MCAGGRWHEDLFEVFRAFAERPVIARDDVIALAALNRLRQRHAAKRGLYDALEHAHVDIAPGKLGAVGRDVEIAPAENPVGKSRAGAGNACYHRLDVAGQRLDFCQVVAGHLDPEGRADAGRDHVHADLDRISPAIHKAGHIEALVKLGSDVVYRYAGPPLVLRLQGDPAFDHGERRGVCRGVGAAGLTEDALDFGHGHDDAIGLAENFPHLRGRCARQGCWHVQKFALIERRHEFRTDTLYGHDHAGRECDGYGYRHPLEP